MSDHERPRARRRALAREPAARVPRRRRRGPRRRHRAARWPPSSRSQQIVQIDVDAEEIGRNHPVHGRSGRRRRGRRWSALLERLRADGAAAPSRKREREQLRDAQIGLDTQEPRSLDPEGAARGHAGRRHRHRRHDPDRLLLAPVLAGLSAADVPHARPTPATSASSARRRSAPRSRARTAPSSCIAGDGGFLYNAQELSTAARDKINAVIVVFNDKAYGNVARDLDESWGGSTAPRCTNPDFMKLADAYGVVGMRATKPTDVGDLVAQGGRDGPPRADRGAGGTDGAPGLLRADEGARQVPAALTGRRGASRPPPFWWPAWCGSRSSSPS